MPVPTTSSWIQTTRHASQTVLEDNIDVQAMMTDVSLFTGRVMERKTVWMDPMKRIALPSLVNQGCSSVRTIKPASLEFESAMESLTVVIDQMKPTVTVLVVNMLSSVSQQEDASPILGSAMEMMTVQMDPMRIPKTVIQENVIPRLNTSAIMESVSPNFGSVTSKTTVVTTLTNLLIDVVTETAQQDGRSVPLETTIDAFLPGYSVTEKTTAGMALMNPTLTTVQSAIILETSSVETEGVSLFDGDVISRMTVETTLMKTVQCVLICIVNVQSLSSNVETKSVFLLDGDVIMMMTAMMDLMKRTVMTTNANRINSSVDLDTVSWEDWSVMDTKTVGMSLMR